MLTINNFITFINKQDYARAYSSDFLNLDENFTMNGTNVTVKDFAEAAIRYSANLRDMQTAKVKIDYHDNHVRAWSSILNTAVRHKYDGLIIN